MALSFAPRPAPPRPRKRSRATADVDGEHSCLRKKKRRLRLFLITSRLSPHFSHPATNIVDRGSSKIAVWAKQKALGRNLLRKAAILNRIRQRAMTFGGFGRAFVDQEKEQKQLELARLTFIYGSHDAQTRPVLSRGSSFEPPRAVRKGNHFEVTRSPPESRSPTPPSSPLQGPVEEDSSDYRSPNDAYSYSSSRTPSPRRPHLPLPPSPLGLSNYAALDLEDDVPDPYAQFDEDDEDPSCYGDVAVDDPPSPSTTTSVSLASTSSTAQTRASEFLKSPSQPLYSDFGILRPDEPLVEDSDQADEGANPIWPASLGIDQDVAKTMTTSPDFPTIVANAAPASSSVSPNFPAASGPTSVSPNFVSSPKWTAATWTGARPMSPNFAHFSENQEKRSAEGWENWVDTQRPDVLAKEESDFEQERERQKNLMWMQLGS